MRKVLAFIVCFACFGAAANDMQSEGSWFFKTKVNKMTDTTDMVASNATKDVYTRQGSERYTSLVLRCKENETDAYISVYDYLGSGEPRITVRFDDGKPVKQTWNSSEGGSAAFSPNAISFIKELAKHKKVIIGFEPYGSTMQAVEFDLSGTDKVAAKIAESCNWKL
ncbi:hypothetical protein JY552_04605 [Serratia marcescens]|nr:hypothetical protein [Serratia marcescens]MBN5410237.1 hypothetical protein [Serratia marcescens]